MAKGTDARPRGPGSDDVPSGVPGPEGAAETTWALSPTDLTFLWDECPRCFYNKVVLKQPRPRGPFPKVFGAHRPGHEGLLPGPAGRGAGPGRATGRDRGRGPVGEVGAHRAPGVALDAVVIRGRVDALVPATTARRRSSTSRPLLPSDDHLEHYGRQLHAYALALEQPSVGPPTPVSGLGLLSFSPERFETTGEEGALRGGLTWTELPLDRTGFQVFLGQVLALLDQPETATGQPRLPVVPPGEWASAA